ncbi:MAG TPA: hypothetical protein VJL83_01695 [Patescibacteria group bacterium]|nr:hypothetical protein [Patescibacteria group bacterium]
MKLPKVSDFLKSRTSSGQKTYFLALQVGTTCTKAAVWQDDETRTVQSVGKHEDTHQAIVDVVGGLPVQNVILGVPDHYIDNNELKESFQPSIQAILERTHLTPIGFVPIREAIMHALEAEYETPQTVLLLGLEGDKLSLSLYRVGILKRITSVPRTGNLIQDFEKALDSFAEEEIFPSKIILYNEGKELDQIKEKLLSYPWQKNDKFLHVPKIIPLPWDYSIRAIVHAGLSVQAGQSIPADLTVAASSLPKDEQTEKTADHFPPSSDEQPIADQPPVQPPIASEQDEEDNLGFVTDVDIADEEKNTMKQEEPEEEAHPSSMHHAPAKDEPVPPTETAPIYADTPFAPETAAPDIKTRAPEKRRSLLPMISLPHSLTVPNPQQIIPLAAALFILGVSTAGAAYWYPHTTVELIVQPESLEKEVTITVNTASSEPDIASEQIPGNVYSTTVSQTKTAPATGTKTTGEKAKGDVIVYNKSTSEKILKKGTVLAATSEVSFTLDGDVAVASASDTGESLEYGKEKVSVIASRIGPAGNVKGDTEFAVADFPKTTLLAKNDAAFSGGSEREITVVSAEDQKSLLAALIEELSNEAKDKLASQIPEDEEELDESLNENVVEKRFDSDVGDESEQLTLDLTLEFSQISVKKTHIDQFLSAYVAEGIPEGYELSPEKSSFAVSEPEKSDENTFTFTALYHGVLFPTIDTESLPGTFTNLTVDELDGKVQNMTQNNIIGYALRETRTLPFFSNRLPMNKNNITVTLVPY